ncbi:MAG: peptide chain release factor-like protein [Kofleriaceae bacterium]
MHRSPARRRASRKRWFAAITLHDAHVDDGEAIAIPRAELVITACRAGGPGGQHVNKVSSAVRVQHVPSGISIRCTSSRSQKANLDHALRRLAGVLRDRAEATRAGAVRGRHAAHHQLERGRPMRSYQLEDDVLVERNPP